MPDKRTSTNKTNTEEDLLFKTHRDLETIEKAENEKISKGISDSGTGLIGAIGSQIPASSMMPIGFILLSLFTFVSIVIILIALKNPICWGVFIVSLLAIIPMFLFIRKQGRDEMTRFRQA